MDFTSVDLLEWISIGQSEVREQQKPVELREAEARREMQQCLHTTSQYNPLLVPTFHLGKEGKRKEKNC